jgi:cytochrome c oxidase subunit 2
MAPTLTDDQAVEDVIAYLETLTPEILPKTIEGDVAKGKELYQVCGACHGDDGKGIEERSTPRIAGEPDWYLERQIGNFSKRIRGDHADDIFGRQMAVINDLLLQDEQAVKDVIAYINTMPAD